MIYFFKITDKGTDISSPYLMAHISLLRTTLKWKCHYFDEIYITGSTQETVMRTGYGNEDISISVWAIIALNHILLPGYFKSKEWIIINRIS